jgi:ribosomal protein L7/L12
MYCSRCKQPVAAERTGHAVRNTLGAALTAGLSLKSERWHCPKCGGPAESERFRKLATPPEQPPVGSVTVTLIHPGPKTIPALRVYRGITHAGLRTAREAFEQVPTIIGHYPPTEAERIRAELAAAGCAVETSESKLGAPRPDGAGDVADALVALARLHETGSLSAEEFAAAKARLLSR